MNCSECVGVAGCCREPTGCCREATGCCREAVETGCCREAAETGLAGVLLGRELGCIEEGGAGVGTVCCCCSWEGWGV